MAETTGLFGALSERLASPAMLAEGSPLVYGFYAIAIGVVVAIVLIIVDAKWPFLPLNPVAGPSAAARAGRTFWKPSNDTENLFVGSDQSPITQPDVWTMSLQLMIGDSRAPDLGKFRHVAHRGANPCGLSPAAGKQATGHAGIQKGDLDPSTDPNYIAVGLPAIMNPGLFLDKYKNDLHIFIHTLGREAVDGQEDSVLWLESTTIEDLPLGAPITVGLVCNGKQLEVYLNCRLYSTMMLRGTPYLPNGNNNWFGRYCAYPFSGIVQNLQLWGTALSSGDYAKMCTAPAASSMDSRLPSSCPTA